MVEVMGLIGLPLTFRIFSARANHGFAFAKVVTLLLISYVAWILGHLGVLSYPASLMVAIALYLGLSLYLLISSREAMLAWLRGGGLRAIALHDGLWTFGFLFFAWQRSLAPEIMGAEKYMDFAFYNSLMRTEVMPPPDPWMSGETFNYYYFGYLMMANLGRLVPMVTQLSYNLCVATLGGLGFSLATAVGLMLTRSLPFALLTGAMMTILGNLDGALQYFQKGTVMGIDLWRSTRVVGGDSTINEFPYFTIIHGDMHPHFIVLPVAILLWALLSDPDRRPSAPGALSSSRDVLHYVPIVLALASSIVISPWELPVSAMMTFLLLQREVPWWPLLSWARIRAGIATGVLLGISYLLYLPFYLRFTAPPGGVGIKFATTSLFQFLTVFGGLLGPVALYLAYQVSKTSVLAVRREVLHALAAVGLLAVLVLALAGGGSVNLVFLLLLALIGAALVSAYRGDSEEDAQGGGDQRIVSLLVLGALAALLACELVYIKDAYGDKLYRMNTVFKLYFQAWILLVLAAPWCWQQLLVRREVPSLWRNLSMAVVGALLLASCAYPIGRTMTQMAHRPVRTLDGNEYLRRDHPNDFAAIEWLRTNVADMPVILEATGNPYSYYARVSSNVGVPTVLGWANHEGLWRGHDQIVGQRRSDVTRIYSARSLAEVQALLDRYQVEYIVVGEVERQDYPAEGLNKFAELREVFRSEGSRGSGPTIIYQR